jgi:single-strand DNA-binding protein
MNNLNSVLIEGNLVRDPLLRKTPKGTSIGGNYERIGSER